MEPKAAKGLALYVLRKIAAGISVRELARTTILRRYEINRIERGLQDLESKEIKSITSALHMRNETFKEVAENLAKAPNLHPSTQKSIRQEILQLESFDLVGFQTVLESYESPLFNNSTIDTICLHVMKTYLKEQNNCAAM